MALTTYLFGNYFSSSSARRYYTALSVEHYQNIYREVCGEVLKSVGWHEALPQSFENDNSGYIGARYCPEIEHVKSVISSIRNELRSLRKNLILKAGVWIDFHNQYTAYVVYVQGILTGIRSVETPFIGPDQMIRELNIAVFRDKDTEDQFHTRSIPLHNKTKALADAYNLHRNAVLVRLAAVNPSATLELRSDSFPFIFFLSTEGRWQFVKPSTLSVWLEKFTPLPLNSNRKLIRNYLCEMGISPHAIDTLLGHASRGEPFWGTHATRAFRELEHELLGGLEKLSSEVGLHVEQGLVV